MADLSEYQRNILGWLEMNAGTGKHLIGSGVAGCGKTFTAMELFKLGISLGLTDGCYMAFNRDIRESVRPKLPRGINSETYNSHGNKAIKQSFGGVQFNENKLFDYLNQFPQVKYLRYKIKKLVELCKINGIVGPDDIMLDHLANEFDVDFEDEQGKENQRQKQLAFDFTRKSIQYSIDNCTVADYADQLFLPYIMPEYISMPQYQLLIIDELQDTSLVQMGLAIRSVVEGGTIIGIGDRWQAIYAFRGAGATSVDDFKKGTGADELPLSLCYRCPKSIGKLVNIKFPEIVFETTSWAKEGSVNIATPQQATDSMHEGDLVLCRVNKYLVEGAFDAIRSGKRAMVKGRAIGQGIETLIKKSRAGTTKEFLDWLDAWRERETEKALRRDNQAKYQEVQDKFETILVIADGTMAVDELSARCKVLFDEDPQNCIMFSSVHKAKGLEAKNVFILHDELMPHPAAKSIVDIQQERNIEYVAITRSMENLTYIRDKKDQKELPKQAALPEPVSTLIDEQLGNWP